MWQTPQQCLALLELLVRSTLKRRSLQNTVFDILIELPWTRATGRRDEIGLVAEHRAELVELIERVWPQWHEALAQLTAYDLPPTPAGWAKLQDIQRANNLPLLPLRLNRRTAASLVAPHSKAILTASRHAALGVTEATHDGLARIRPAKGLVAVSPKGNLDLEVLAGVLGEVPIPERALLDGLVIQGAIRAVLLVENLGAWRDFPEMDGWLLVHIPGWDTATALLLLNGIDQSVPVIHFGDLDPNGVRIYLHLRDKRPDLLWFVPPFWGECAQPRSLGEPWPDELSLDGAPALLVELIESKQWLEQEPLVVDARTVRALEALLLAT
ncbi:Wadjet anti-phage system protein JetD domain-containing protein [Pseudomonas sp. FW300-N2A2]|uniref:Wadjet anti-phage system protein JetD domain-containing protein n=1 Tax=Pseudomonas sp. FW300-N2A2 TaxID=2751316 RepID=UPI001A90FD25|nr:Wadjet anti-phage system protein JetD domain-containing protein [Pseudomonas sp. FW300-N2A2]